MSHVACPIDVVVLRRRLPVVPCEVGQVRVEDATGLLDGHQHIEADIVFDRRDLHVAVDREVVGVPPEIDDQRMTGFDARGEGVCS
jgi:hypothetical protein